MTPRVLTARVMISPSVLLYSTEARLAGTQAMSRSPLMREGVTSSAAPARVKSYMGPSAECGASLINFTSPMAVGPFRAAMRVVTGASTEATGASSCTGVSCTGGSAGAGASCLLPQAVRDRASSNARDRETIFFIIAISSFGFIIEH